jgi:import inner membrane translocase subunit TIM10B
VPSLCHRTLDAEEEACLHSCAGKLIHSNHCLLAAYVHLMLALVHCHFSDSESPSVAPGVPAEQIRAIRVPAIPGPRREGAWMGSSMDLGLI